MKYWRTLCSLSITLIAVLAFSGVAVAQDAGGEASSDDKKDDKVEELVVTGSRIKRMDLTTPAPVTVLTRDQINAQGLVSIGDVLQNLPTQNGGINAQANNGGDGSVRVSLRGLGSGRTLVLLNGRRFVPGGTGVNSSVDLQAIPAAVIERVEILKDGASAVYGSDAIGGVVNIITRSDFDGSEGTAYYGVSPQGDGQVIDVSVTAGHTAEKGNIVFSAGYVQSKPIWTGDRDFSQTDKAYDWATNDGSWDPNGSSATPQGTLIDRLGEEGNAEWQSFNGENFPDASGFYYNDPTDGWRDFNSSGNSDDGSGDYYNYQPENYLFTPQQRYNLFTAGNYQLSDSVRSFFEAQFLRRQSRQKLAPTPLFIISEGITVAADNQYNPFDRNFIDIRRRFVEAGNRKFIQDLDTYRMVLGLDGNVPFMSGWLWDASFTYGRTSGTAVNEGRFIRSRVEQALGPAADCTGDCVPLNLFGGPGSITPEMLDYISYVGTAHGWSDQRISQVNLSGDLFELPGGMAAVAAGYAFRQESGGYIPDPMTATGNTTGNKEDATEGNYDVHSGYLELALPLLADMPGVELLELSAALRNVNYSSFGSNTSWKIGLRWQVIDDLAVRGTYSTAFAAPQIASLYLGTSDSFPLVSDPCSTVDEAGSDRTLTADQKANCAAEGVPDDFEDSRAQLRSLIGGNTDLEPETAKIMTGGLVFEPAFLEGFSMTLDYYSIKIENAITTLGANVILSSCFSQPDAEYCDKVQRDPTTHLITNIVDTVTNAGGTTAAGMDFSMVYGVGTGFGRLGVSVDGTWLQQYDVELPDGRVIEGKGVYDLGVNPDLKVNSALTWSMDDLGAGMNFRFIGGFEECQDDDCTVEDDPETEVVEPVKRDVDSNLTMDLFFTYNLKSDMGGTALQVGVNNLMDQAPSVIYNGFLGTSDASAYDFVGRYVYVSLTQSL